MASIWEKAISILAGNHFNFGGIWKNISWKRRCQKKRMLLQIKNCTLLWQHWEKRERISAYIAISLSCFGSFFCKHFIKSTCHEFPGSKTKSRCKSNKTRKLFGVSTLRIYCKFCRRKTIISDTTKGQLISKCLFWCLQISQKPNETFSRISVLASKKKSNQKSSVRESK